MTNRNTQRIEPGCIAQIVPSPHYPPSRAQGAFVTVVTEMGDLGTRAGRAIAEAHGVPACSCIFWLVEGEVFIENGAQQRRQGIPECFLKRMDNPPDEIDEWSRESVTVTGSGRVAEEVEQ